MPAENQQKNGSGRDDTAPEILAGRNPVAEALRAGRELECVYLLERSEKTLGKIIALARESGVPIKTVRPDKLESLCPGINHQGVAAVASAAKYAELEDLFRLAERRNQPFLAVICDGIEDPHNLGAVIRTAEAAGAHGVIIPKRRSAGLTPAASKAAAGALEYIPVVRVANLPQTLETLKQRGVWIYAAETGGIRWDKADLTGPAALVVGGEGSGVGRLVKERCDQTLSLPMLGEVNSLNASVACGILLYEIVRQRT